MIQSEISQIYPYDISMDMLNGNSLLKPCGYQTAICDVAEMHLNKFHMNINDFAPYHAAWVLISSAFEIVRPIDREMRIFGRTWHSEQSKLTFRRELTFTDEAGAALFNAATFSVLMDTRTRRILRPDRLEFSVGEATPQFTMEAEPKLRERAEMTKLESRKIYPSYIDCLGHTNNCRYSEFAYDALTDAELSDLRSLRRMEIYFMSELRLGDAFTVRRGRSEAGEIIIDGMNNATGKTSFASKMRFEQR